VQRGLGALVTTIAAAGLFWAGGRSLAGSAGAETSRPGTVAAPAPAPVSPAVAGWLAENQTAVADAQATIAAVRATADAVAANPATPSNLYDTAGDAGAAVRDLGWALPAKLVGGVETKQRWLDCSDHLFALSLAGADLDRQPDDTSIARFRQADQDAEACLATFP
jgi:hypothetical protein